MHLRRLLLWAAIAVVAALPEALIRGASAAVGFQTWLVVQLLGVIVAAIAVAAMFSVLGLGVVRILSWPWRDRPATFVAWSFLRTARLYEAPARRLALAMREAVDAGPMAPPGVRGRLLLAGLVLACGGAAAALAGALTEPTTVTATLAAVALRNIGVAAALHGALVTAAGLPWRPLRLAPAWLLLAAALAAFALLDRMHPAVAPLGGPLWRLCGLVAGAGPWLWVLARPRRGRERTARRVGLAVLAGGAALAAAAAVAAGPLAAAQAGTMAGIFALLLLLHGAARVSVPVFVAIVGVAAGTWALIVVLSVMGGFAADLRSKMLVANAHALVERPGGQAALPQVAALARALRAVPGVAGVSPQVRGDAILGSAYQMHNFVALRGIDPTLAEVAAGVGKVVVVGDLSLLATPEALGQPAWRRWRRGAGPAADLPATPTAGDATAAGSGQPGLGGEDIDALLQLAPGPAAPPTPRPMLAIPSGDRALAIDAEAAPPPIVTDPPAAVAAPSAASPAQEAEALDPLSLGGPAAPPPSAGSRPSALFDLPLEDEESDVPVAPAIVLGVELARNLQVELGDRVEVITPDADVGPTGLRPRLRSFRVAGLFESGLYEADSKVAYVDLVEAARYFNVEGVANVLELRLHDPAAPDATLAAVRGVLQRYGADLRVVDWRELNRSLFSALAFERLVIFLVLGLIILVASFAIVSALTMVILQKRDGIAMLSAMGAAPRTIGGAFVAMGAAIGAIGTTAGLILGLGTCALIATLGISLPEAYYVRTLPVQVIPAEVALVVAASLAVSLVATAFPARTAARSRPLEGLRHD